VIGVMPEATMQLSHALIREAKARDVDVMVTVCPLCQFNLEGFQDRMTKRFGHPHDMSVAFVSQLVGIALGIDEKRLGMQRLIRWRLPAREPVAAGASAPAEGGDDAP
jgi:heterodisulfide reductase subunit B